MGKRKRSCDDHNNNTTTNNSHKINNSSSNNNNNNNIDPSSASLEDMPCSSRTDLLSGEKSFHLLDSRDLKHLSPAMDVNDSTRKLVDVHSPLTHQHYHLGRSLFLKRSRHYYGHKYSRRNLGNHASASSSHGKSASSRDYSFTLTGQSGQDSGCHTENRDKAFSRPERIRFSSLAMDAISSDSVKLICGVCQKPLRRKLYFLGESGSSGEFSVVAVLVCGHVYHADCLEQRTNLEDKRDPPCPLCLGLLAQADTSRGEA